MARYDKYNPVSGGFRAVLAADFDPGTANTADPLNPQNFNKVFPCVLNASGAILAPAAATYDKFMGVFIVSGPRRIAGDVLDVMTAGEIVDFDDGKYGGVVAGQAWYADPLTGLLISTLGTVTAATNYFYVGRTVEPGRLIVRCQRGQF